MGLNLNRELKDFEDAREKGDKHQSFKSDEDYKAARISAAQYTNSPEYRAMQAASIKSGTGRNTAQQGLLAAQTGAINAPGMTDSIIARNRAYSPQPGQTPQGPDFTGDAPYVSPTKPAAPVAPPNAVQSELDPMQAPMDTGAIPTDPTQMAASGGMIRPVKKYASGGAVDDESDDTTADPSSDDATAASTPTYDDGRSYSLLAANDGVQAGLQQMAAGYGNAGSSTAQGSGFRRPPGQRAPTATAQSNMANDQQIAAARKFVDPEGKLPENERNLAALGVVWSHFVKAGDTEKGARAAAGMLQFYKQESSKYADIAKRAADGGDAATASSALMKAYNYVPDGRDTKLVPTPDGRIQFQSTGVDGKVTRQGIVSPKDIAAAATGFIDGDSFEKALTESAGIRDQKQGTTPKPVALKPAERGAIETSLGTSYDKATGKKDDGDQPKGLPDADEERQIHGAAFRILGGNDHITTDDAMNAALTLSGIKTPKADTRGFQNDIKRQPDGSYVASMPGGPPVKLDAGTVKQLMAIRAQRVKPEGPDMDAKDRPSAPTGLSGVLGTTPGGDIEDRRKDVRAGRAGGRRAYATQDPQDEPAAAATASSEPSPAIPDNYEN